MNKKHAWALVCCCDGLMALIVGVDEAGRGPVIGPLVLCAFACRRDEEPRLRELGVKDSKLLSDSRREELAPHLRKFPHALLEVSAAEITHAMRTRVSLNELEAMKVAEAVAQVAKSHDVEKLYVDSPDAVPSKFERRIRKYLPASLKKMIIVSENKADFTYACVSAASVLAKSLREQRVRELREAFGFDFGSGYPSDPRTKSFLAKHRKDAGLQTHLRHEWETLKRTRTAKVKLEDFA